MFFGASVVKRVVLKQCDHALSVSDETEAAFTFCAGAREVAAVVARRLGGGAGAPRAVDVRMRRMCVPGRVSEISTGRRNFRSHYRQRGVELQLYFLEDHRPVRQHQEDGDQWFQQPIHAEREL